MIMKDQETTKLEFLMMVNNNIIVQRFFNVRIISLRQKTHLSFMNTFMS